MTFYITETAKRRVEEGEKPTMTTEKYHTDLYCRVSSQLTKSQILEIDQDYVEEKKHRLTLCSYCAKRMQGKKTKTQKNKTKNILRHISTATDQEMLSISNNAIEGFITMAAKYNFTGLSEGDKFNFYSAIYDAIQNEIIKAKSAQ